MELLGEAKEIVHGKHLTLLRARSECLKNVRGNYLLYIIKFR